MSKSIDEKIVSMQFDNSKFESNAQQSISTLDKLKEAISDEYIVLVRTHYFISNNLDLL